MKVAFLCLISVLVCGIDVRATDREKVLVLSGANNHDWKQTTPVIVSVLEKSGRFEVEVENRVMEMEPGDFKPYAVILSDFNTFGRDAPEAKEWPESTRRAFLEHMSRGKGLVIVHAGSSVFYGWPEFHKLATGTWGKQTRHGKIHFSRVSFTDDAHPVTKGLSPFWIRDEFWENIKVASGAHTLATVTPDPASGGSGEPEPVVLTTEVDGGRGFGLFLGHDAEIMANTAWRSLLLRGVEWAATGKVTIPPAADWPSSREAVSKITTP